MSYIRTKINIIIAGDFYIRDTKFKDHMKGHNHIGIL
jgi:hypothetical protein